MHLDAQSRSVRRPFLETATCAYMLLGKSTFRNESLSVEIQCHVEPQSEHLPLWSYRPLFPEWSSRPCSHMTIVQSVGHQSSRTSRWSNLQALIPHTGDISRFQTLDESHLSRSSMIRKNQHVRAQKDSSPDLYEKLETGCPLPAISCHLG